MTSRYDGLWEAYIIDFKKAFFNHDFRKAHLILESAFADAEEFSEIDFRLVASTHSLASSYCQRNRQTDAADLFKRFIELREKVLGPDDPDVAESLESVAMLQLDSLNAMAS